MDRIYVKHAGRPPVHQLGLDTWRDAVLRSPHVGDRARAAALAAVDAERRGGVADRALLRSFTSMLADVGADVYSEEFEAPFLADTSRFYDAEAAALVRDLPPPAYLAAAETRLTEEADRVAHYLDPATAGPSARAVEAALLGAHVSTLVHAEAGGAVALVRDDAHADLSRMYTLLARVPGGLDEMRTAIADHAAASGARMVADPALATAPIPFVEALLAAKDKYDAVVARACGGDKAFAHALASAFERFVNAAPRAPEYVSLYMDDRLRRATRAGAAGPAAAARGGLGGGVGAPNGAPPSTAAPPLDDEAALDRVMAIFRYLQDKDVFERYHKAHLARRLLSGRPLADDAERALLARLKTECGYQFTSRLECMLTDVKTSADLAADWKAAGGGSGGGVELAVHVLTTGAWPTPPPSRAAMPPSVAAVADEFAKFYHAKHGGRRLAWQPGMGGADLRAEFGGRRHELSVTAHQAAILLLFNEGDGFTAEAIGAATGVPAGELPRALQSLACARGRNVLRKAPPGRDVAPGDTFFFNDGFTSKLFKVKVGTVSSSREAEPERAGTRARVEEDRKPQVDAAIVRVMKARRVLDHNSVVAEATLQLASRFAPTPALIKQRVESLIEREYLERDANDRKLYRYLA
jgi:cullin 3